MNPPKYLRTNVWRAYTTCQYESVQLKTVLALYEQDIEPKNTQPSYQRTEKTMVKKFLDQKVRAQNFEARNEQNRERKPRRKAEAKGSQSALKGKKEVVISGTQSALKETPAVSARTTLRSQTNNDGNTFFETAAQGHQSIWKKLRRQCREDLNGNCTTSSCGSRHSLCVSITDLNRASSVKRARSRTMRLIVRRINDPRWVVEKVLEPLERTQKPLGCVFQDVEQPRFKSILRKSSTMSTPIRFVQFTNAVLRRSNLPR